MATSKEEASQAGKDLQNPDTPEEDRGPIASALAQSERKEEDGETNSEEGKAGNQK